jgi:hypothetical protein
MKRALRKPFILLASLLFCPVLSVAEPPSMTTSSTEPVWVNPQPDVPYFPKPATRPVDWLVEHEPVNPNVSPEARALLKFLYAVSNKHTLTGQHNYPAEQHYSTQFTTHLARKTPAIYGTDWGFAAIGDKDSAYTRQATVDTLIDEYHKGSIITLCWHEVRPTEDEPVTFPKSIRGTLTEQQFEDLLTPGTPLYQRWCAQVDVIADYMKQLQAARVPILFRPYHEMNGDWFWWGGRRGNRGSAQLYRQIFDRFVNYHHLDNLIWVWNVDRPTREDREFVDYFPGPQYVDVLSLDDYHDFLQSYYDDLNALSDGKVLAIGETTNPPTMDLYQTQPKWAFWMRWAFNRPHGPAKFAATRALVQSVLTATRPTVPLSDIVSDPRMLSREDPAYQFAIAPVRTASGLTNP